VELLPMMVGAVLLAFFAYLAAVMWFAHRHPEQALLEGAEIIQYREQEMAVKGVSTLPQVQSTEPPPVARLEK
jgi:hypothetical protein